MNKNFLNDKCCGCTACKFVCPENCINIKQNQYGFWHANHDYKMCIECGLCMDVCPLRNQDCKEQNAQQFFIAASKQKDIYERSSSGGVFPLIAVEVLNLQGKVWGCGYSEELLPMHKGIEKIEELDDLCRSKYVQSYLGETYLSVKKQLEKDKKVLFCGTPCQVAGLKNYLGENNDKLYLIDIICHGVPSAGLFSTHIRYLEKKFKKKLKRYEFRLKDHHKNHLYHYFYCFDDGSSRTGPYFKDVFFNAFYEMESLNDICYDCPFACKKRTGDLTIGDFEWGKKYHQNYNKFQEVSCIIVNTKKGKDMLDWVKKDMLIEPTKWDYIIERNKNLVRPTPRPVGQKKFYDSIIQRGYKKWAKKYFFSLKYLKKQKYLIKLGMSNHFKI